MRCKFQLITLIVFSIVTIFGTAYCKTLSDVAEEFQSDMEYVFFLSPDESSKIFKKYSDNYVLELEFREILDNSGRYDQRLIVDIMTISAISKNKKLFEKIRSVYLKNPAYYKQVTQFYYYRIGFESDKYLKLLIAEFEKLLVKTYDSQLITFLPFWHDIDVALKYLDELSAKSDGVVAELLHWSTEYLYYLNRDTPKSLRKIKGSRVYQLFLKNK